MQSHQGDYRTGAFPSDPVEMVLVVVAELPLAEDPALPPGEGEERVRQEPQGVIRREDRKPDHVAKYDDQKKVLELSAQLADLDHVLVREHPEEKLPNRRPPPPAAARHAISSVGS